MQDFITIKVLGWDKHNPKRDQKTYTWFKFSNDFFTSQTMFNCTVQMRILYIALCCLCSKKCSNVVRMNTKWAAHCTQCDVSELFHILKKLEEFQIIEIVAHSVSCKEMSRHLNKNRIEQNRKEKIYIAQMPENQAEKCSNEHPLRQLEIMPADAGPSHPLSTGGRDSDLFFYFEELYQNHYPRKIGKSRGLKKCVRDVKKNERHDFELAIKNYADFVQQQNTEEKFIKHFSSWVGEWRDWIEKPKNEFDQWAEDFINDDTIDET